VAWAGCWAASVGCQVGFGQVSSPLIFSTPNHFLFSIFNPNGNSNLFLQDLNLGFF
jgi:hypothetical protein